MLSPVTMVSLGGVRECASETNYCGHLAEDVLVADIHHECQICFEDMVAGETAARLPCLCLYHKEYVLCFEYCVTHNTSICLFVSPVVLNAGSFDRGHVLSTLANSSSVGRDGSYV